MSQGDFTYFLLWTALILFYVIWLVINFKKVTLNIVNKESSVNGCERVWTGVFWNAGFSSAGAAILGLSVPFQGNSSLISVCFSFRK